MEYLIRNNPKNHHKAHLWDGNDTLCRMFSTGGLISRDGYSIRPEKEPFRHTCLLCQTRDNTLNGIPNRGFITNRPTPKFDITQAMNGKK